MRGSHAPHLLAWAAIIIAIEFACPAALANPDDLDRLLTAREVATYFAPYQSDVRACYLTNATGKTADGSLRIELIIHRNGSVFRFGFVAPGVDKRALPKLDACLRKLAATWRFPVRRGFTTAVLPFLYLKTWAPNAGPQESCWDARGCPPGKLRTDSTKSARTGAGGSR